MNRARRLSLKVILVSGGSTGCRSLTGSIAKQLVHGPQSKQICDCHSDLSILCSNPGCLACQLLIQLVRSGIQNETLVLSSVNPGLNCPERDSSLCLSSKLDPWPLAWGETTSP
eukprot:g61631.t1